MGPTDFFEETARACGFRHVAGLDEAGRGPLAGPVVAAAVILPRLRSFPQLDDSKLISQEDRQLLYDLITSQAQGWAIGVGSEQEIDRFNILGATKLACCRALASLSLRPDFLLLDALRLPMIPLPQREIIKGDQLSLSIAAASIIAKVTRDRIMDTYHQRFPDYQFHIHKGYPTPDHLNRLQQFGPCEGHRRSFKPVRELLEPAVCP